MSQGFIKLYREKAIELLEVDPKAYLLLSQIALRARRTDKEYSRVPLKANQAFIGDPEKAGLTAQEYKNAKKRLTKYGLATFEPCTKGTIATMINKEVFDINAEENILVGKPSVSPRKNQGYQPTKNQQITTKEPMEIHQETIEEPLTRKEECKKTTTTVVDDAFFYTCLQKHQQLSDMEKRDLMKYPEDRVMKAIEWTAQIEIKTTLIQALHWHCLQTMPPLLPEKALRKSSQENAAWEYNRFLESQGHDLLAIKNRESIPKHCAYIISGGTETSISLNNPIDLVKNDFRDSINEILNSKTRNELGEKKS